MPGQLIRLFHTARHLRVEQIHGRIRRHVLARSHRSGRRDDDDVPAFPGCRWPANRTFLPPATVGLDGDAIRQGRFHFLNVTRELGFPPDWDCPGEQRLWRYNLHYGDWLWRLDFDAARRVAVDWITRYDDRCGVGWEPYPTSVRLLNWCGLFFGRWASETQSDRDFAEMLWRSVYRQCRWLGRHVETHLLNNHTLENGAALAFVGSCFRGDAARRWLDKGRRILAEQIGKQVLPDGMHFELSPMYHCRVLYVLKLLSATGAEDLAELVAEPVRRMARALGKLCHPDGRIALLSDSALDVCHEPAHLGAAAGPVGCFALAESGYYGWRGSDGTYLIADYGPIGPDHNPGHGHADIFSFELSLQGCRVVTDAGVFDYEPSESRRYCRSTAAHNTVEIDGQDQCELWDAFRVARRGYPQDVRWEPRDDGFALGGWHDGYRRLPGKPIHTRRLHWHRTEGLLIRDEVRSRRCVACVSRLHLHPNCRIVASGPRFVVVSYPAGTFRIEANGPIEIGETPYSARFYETVMRPSLRLTGSGSALDWSWRIATTGLSAERVSTRPK